MGAVTQRVLFHLQAALFALAAAAAGAWVAGSGEFRPWAVGVFATAQAVAMELFRTPRLDPSRAGFQDALTLVSASLSGGAFALLAVSGVPGARLVIAAQAFHLCGLLLGLGVLCWRRRRPAASDARRALLVDTGPEAETLLRDLHQASETPYDPIGWLAGDVSRRYRILCGLPILGSIEELPYLVEWHQIAAVLAVVSRTNHELRRRLQEHAETAGVELLLILPISERLADARGSAKEHGAWAA